MKVGNGGTQTAGGNGPDAESDNDLTSNVGIFGIGGYNNYYWESLGGAGGGSSFISGYDGCNAITSSTDRTATGQSVHYCNMTFIETTMTAGVNDGNGYARITYIP